MQNKKLTRQKKLRVFFPSSSSFSLPACTPWSLDLPEVIVDGQGVHADWHRLGRDDIELLAVWAVFVELVDHLMANSAWSCACELDDLLSVRWVTVYGAELAPTVAEEDDQMIGLALFQLLRWVKHTRNIISKYGKTWVKNVFNDILYMLTYTGIASTYLQ